MEFKTVVMGISTLILMCIVGIEGRKREIRKGKARCADFRGIKRELVENIETKVKRSNGTVFSIPSEIEVSIMTRDVWNAYCYHGSAIDPNTGCDPKGTTLLLPDRAEAMIWHNQKKCKIGVTCGQFQEDCRGDQARKCLSNELTKWVPESNGGYDSWWMQFPHHTCAKTWNCKIRESKITPVLTSDGDIRVEINIRDEWYTVYSKGEFQDYFISERNKLVVYVPKFKIAKDAKQIKCIDNQNHVECVLENSITGSTEIVEMGGGRWSIGRTTALKGDKKSKITKVIEDQREEVTRAASINDLKRVILSTHYTQAEIDENFERVNINFLKIANMIIGLIEYNTKKDDTAFSVITGEDKIMKWISPEILRVCKIHKEPWLGFSNCMNGTHYAGGSYHSTMRYKCHKPNEIRGQYKLDMKLDSLKNTTIYDVDDLGTTSSEKINRELAEERIRRVESRIENQRSSKSGGVEASSDLLGYLSPSSLFSTISNYLVYINSALIVLILIRR